MNDIGADGKLSNAETAMIEQYQQEMNLSIPLEKLSGDADSALAVFQDASLSVKKQLLFELIGLAYADNDYAKEENDFLEKSCSVLGMSLTDLEICKKYISELLNLYEKIGQFVAE